MTLLPPPAAEEVQDAWLLFERKNQAVPSTMTAARRMRRFLPFMFGRN